MALEPGHPEDDQQHNTDGNLRPLSNLVLWLLLLCGFSNIWMGPCFKILRTQTWYVFNICRKYAPSPGVVAPGGRRRRPTPGVFFHSIFLIFCRAPVNTLRPAPPEDYQQHNTEFAMRARNEIPAAASVPEDLFLREVSAYDPSILIVIFIAFVYSCIAVN